MDINPEDNTSYTTQLQKTFLRDVENEYCAKHRCVPVIKPKWVPSNNVFRSATPSGCGQCSFEPDDSLSDDEEYLMPNNVAEISPVQSLCAAHLLTAARLNLHSLPESPKNCGQVNPNLNDYISNQIEISSTFWLSDITDWWQQQEKMHSSYTDLSNVVQDIISIIPHDVGVEGSLPPGRDVIGWRQWKTIGETVRERVVVRQFAWSNNGILVGDDPAWDMVTTENNFEMMRKAEEWKLHRKVKVHNFMEMWQGSQNLCTTQKDSLDQNEQITAVWYILDAEEVVTASWALLQPDGAAAFEVSEPSPLPPALSAKDLPGGQTQILNVSRIRRINRHPVERDEDSAHESILHSENWLNWNGDLDNSNTSEEDSPRDIESDIERDISIEDRVSPDERDVSAATYIPGLNQQWRSSQWQAENVLVMVHTLEMRRNKGIKKKADRMRQYVSPDSLCSLTERFI